MTMRCEACKTVDRLEVRVQRASAELDERRTFHTKACDIRDSWLRRLLAGLSLTDALNAVDAAHYAFVKASQALDDARAELERAEDRVPGAAVEKAAQAIAADVERDIFADIEEGFGIKGLAKALDDDLRFEDKVKETKLDDLVKAKVGVEQDHSVHQGTHYVGDPCPGPSSNKDDLRVMYDQLPTSELKDHYEAAMESFVARGVASVTKPKKKPTKKEK